MRRLYHWTMDPEARMVRLALGEQRLTADLILSSPSAPHEDIAKLALGASGVAYIDQARHGRVVSIGGHAIVEYLHEAGGLPKLLPGIEQDRAEARRIWQWIDMKFQPVTESLLQERILQSRGRPKAPNSTALRQGAHALRGAVTFLNALAERRPFLAGRHLSVADLAAAGHLSAYDYFGDVQWESVPDLRDWYMRMKSRPSFRPLLADTLAGARPAKHYADLDF